MLRAKDFKNPSEVEGMWAAPPQPLLRMEEASSALNFYLLPRLPLLLSSPWARALHVDGCVGWRGSAGLEIPHGVRQQGDGKGQMRLSARDELACLKPALVSTVAMKRR